MAGGGVISTTITTNPAQITLLLVHDVVRIAGAGFSGFFKRECMTLSRRVALLAYLLEEIRDFNKADPGASSSSSSKSCLSDLLLALQSAKRLLLTAGNFDPKISPEGASKKITHQFHYVTWKLEKALGTLPYDHFDISEEVKEQVELVRAQLRRAIERYGGPLNSNISSDALVEGPLDKESDALQSGNGEVGGFFYVENIGTADHAVNEKVECVPEIKGLEGHCSNCMILESEGLTNSTVSPDTCVANNVDSDEGNDSTNEEENKKSDSPSIPDDFLCPISLELMRDPVIVATGQTYERSYIQRWMDCGNKTCPKTQQKLRNLTLTPNYVLRSLISQWCAKNSVDQPMALMNGMIKKSDGSLRDVSGDIPVIEALVRKLSSRSTEECRAAVSEIRSLSKRSTDNRILIAEAGAIPFLVNLLASDDNLTQENAVTATLNLSIYENNKGLIMLAGAVPSIIQVLRAGSMEARENAAATLFSLSLADENKIIIGTSGAIPALVELLKNGSTRGKKDAAIALFNLCIYQGNKGRAVRAGIITALLNMLTDASSFMVDEALTILSILASNHEAKIAISKANTIPVLIDLIRTGLPQNKENASAVLLSLCRRDCENLACLNRLGAVAPLIELAKNGTERAKRKAMSLLEQLQKPQCLQQVN